MDTKATNTTDDKKGKPVQTLPQPTSGGMNKESLGDGIDAGYKEKYWEDYGKELELEKEIKEIGIEKIESGAVKLPLDIADQMGIKPTVTHDTGFHEATGFKIAGVSFSDDQLTTGKKTPVTKSFRWMVEWFIYELLKNNFLIKYINGKITRQKSGEK